MIQVFNSEFEISMRILLLLSTFNEPLNAGYIKSIDLLSIASNMTFQILICMVIVPTVFQKLHQDTTLSPVH